MELNVGSQSLGAAALPAPGSNGAASPASWQAPSYPEGSMIRSPVMTQDREQQGKEQS